MINRTVERPRQRDVPRGRCAAHILFASVVMAVGKWARAEPGPASEQLWAAVVEGTAREAAAIQTVQVRYQLDVRFDHPALNAPRPGSPAPSISYTCRLLEAGARFRQECRIRSTSGVDGGSEPTERVVESIVAYDGRVSRARDGRSPGELLTGTQESVPRRLPPPPELLSFMPVSMFERQRLSGQYRLLEATRVQLGNRPTVRVRFLVPSTGHHLNIWYSEHEGYIAVRGEDTDAAGNVVGTVEVAEIATIKDKGGNVFFYPIRGTRRVLHRGQPLGGDDVRVDRESLVINDDLDAAWFTLRRRPEERMHDVDLLAAVDDADEAVEGPTDERMLTTVPPATMPTQEMPTPSGRTQPPTE